MTSIYIALGSESVVQIPNVSLLLLGKFVSVRLPLGVGQRLWRQVPKIGSVLHSKNG